MEELRACFPYQDNLTVDLVMGNPALDYTFAKGSVKVVLADSSQRPGRRPSSRNVYLTHLSPLDTYDGSILGTIGKGLHKGLRKCEPLRLPRERAEPALLEAVLNYGMYTASPRIS